MARRGDNRYGQSVSQNDKQQQGVEGGEDRRENGETTSPPTGARQRKMAAT